MDIEGTTIIENLVCPNSKCKAHLNIKVITPQSTVEEINYKFKTKGWIKYTAGGATYKENLKVSCGSTIKHKQGNYKSKGTKTRIAFKVKNLHKGDKITVKINGSSYTKKITNVRAKTIYVPVSRTIAYTPFKVTLKNKYRQKMLVKTLYL